MSGTCDFKPEDNQNNNLKEFENQIFSDLKRKHPSVSTENASKLKDYFSNSRNTANTISEVSVRTLWESQWALLGINQRAYQLTMATLQQTNEGNFVACDHCIRGLIESLCSILWVEQKPSRISSLVRPDPPSVGKMLNSGYGYYPWLRKSYHYWSTVTHPARNSHLLCAPAFAATEKGLYWPITFGFSESFTSEIFNTLIACAPSVNKHINNFISTNENCLKSGRKMVQAIPKNS